MVKSMADMRSDTTGACIRLLRPKAVMRALGISRPTLYRMMKSDPSFPSAIKLGGNSIAFVEAELITWVNTRRIRVAG